MDRLAPERRVRIRAAGQHQPVDAVKHRVLQRPVADRREQAQVRSGGDQGLEDGAAHAELAGVAREVVAESDGDGRSHAHLST
jgi:hypothetical protein